MDKIKGILILGAQGLSLLPFAVLGWYVGGVLWDFGRGMRALTTIGDELHALHLSLDESNAASERGMSLAERALTQAARVMGGDAIAMHGPAEADEPARSRCGETLPLGIERDGEAEQAVTLHCERPAGHGGPHSGSARLA